MMKDQYKRNGRETLAIGPTSREIEFRALSICMNPVACDRNFFSGCGGSG